jgi:tetratricopeptide (TPR) repeat protein
LLADKGIRLEEAKGLIEKALAVDPENGAYLDSIGWVYFKLLDYEKAREYLEKAVLNMDSSEEENYVIYDHLGDTYQKLGLRSKAIDAWKKALELKYMEEIRQKLENVERVIDNYR